MDIALKGEGVRGETEAETFELAEMDDVMTGIELRPQAPGFPSPRALEDRPLKIGMISTPFLPVPPKNYGGTELVVHELVEGLKGAGHEVVLFATGDSETSAELRSLYAISQWPPNPLHEQNHVSWAFHQVRQGGFDVLHVHSACGLAYGRLLPEIPLVYTLHHPPLPEFSDFYQSFAEPFYIAISRRQMELEVPLPRCQVIHHGLDGDRFQCVEKAAPFVCFVGRYSECKGPHLAIDAARIAGVPIQIAGEVHAPDRDFAAAELASRLLQPHVTDIGCIGIDRKVPLLRDARALLTPITWEEPFGLIIIEAMLSGCPVVSFPRGSAPELIEPGVTGFLVKDTEEMARVIRPGGVLEDFDRKRCQRRARQRFGRERLIADHARLYRTAVEEWASARCTDSA